MDRRTRPEQEHLPLGRCRIKILGDLEPVRALLPIRFIPERRIPPSLVGLLARMVAPGTDTGRVIQRVITLPASSAQLKILHRELTASAPDSSGASSGFAGSVALLPRQLRRAGQPRDPVPPRPGTGGLMDDRASSVASARGNWTQVIRSTPGTRGSLLRISLPAEGQPDPDLGRSPGGDHIDPGGAAVQARARPEATA